MLNQQTIFFIHPTKKVFNKSSVDNFYIIDYQIIILKMLIFFKRVNHSEIVLYKVYEQWNYVILRIEISTAEKWNKSFP